MVPIARSTSSPSSSRRPRDVYPYTGIDRDGVPGGVLRGTSRDTNLFLRTTSTLGERFPDGSLSGDKRSSRG